MEITIMHTEGCPNLATAEERVREALETIGAEGATVKRELIADAADAERARFPGSPTILIDGTDPFAEPGALPALACRMYRTESGPDGAPSVSQLRAALGTEA